jgi:hypothetical protein
MINLAFPLLRCGAKRSFLITERFFIPFLPIVIY